MLYERTQKQQTLLNLLIEHETPGIPHLLVQAGVEFQVQLTFLKSPMPTVFSKLQQHKNSSHRENNNRK
jgi:hypothetical protein